MSDEKRQTRLLPFRRRRAARFGAEDFAVSGGAEDFAEALGDEDHSADAELTALLRAWEAPPQSADARARLLADFRAAAPARPLWRRALTAELRVPLPVAACAALAFFASLFALGARGWTRHAPAEASQTADAPAEVKVVEVPVVRERVVTRTVYVEKKERAAARVSPSQPAAQAVPREALAQGASPERREADAERHPAEKESNAGYFTRVNMEDFQPADEVKIRIVSRGGTDDR
ncbi:MAG TPA: hypothetical protein VNZ44_08500 [Pyrinomonadaceae bacterium]|nr:hypothetical protein [Pyrinomonadaceae bacterium]